MDLTTAEEPLDTPFWQRLTARHGVPLLALLGIALVAYGLWPQPAPTAEQPLTERATELPSPAPLADEASAEAPQAPVDTASASDTGQDAPAELTVYVAGAVEAPGVYLLPANARVNDAVARAGGLSAEADSLRVNLAELVADGQQIVVPQRGQPDHAAALNDERAEPAGAQGGPQGLIDLNTASASDLEALPRIGAALAGRIIAQREANGPFGSVDDLRAVKGISAGVFAEIAPLVTTR